MDSRNFVLTGMSRSGTSLLAKLITENLPNAFCALEPPGAGFVDELDAYFLDTRHRLINGLPVGNRVTKEGTDISDNPWRSGAWRTTRPA